MKRLLILIAVGFVVLSGSTFWGVHVAEWGARERRAERFAEALLASIQGGDALHAKALGTEELLEVGIRADAFAAGAIHGDTRFREDRWELAYCLGSGEGFEIWVPDPNPQGRARIHFDAATGRRCDAP